MLSKFLIETEITNSEIERQLLGIINPVKRIIWLNRLMTKYQDNVRFFDEEIDPVVISIFTNWLDLCLKNVLEKKDVLSDYEKCLVFLMFPSDGNHQFEFYCVVDSLLREDSLQAEINMINSFSELLDGNYLPIFEKDWLSDKFVRKGEIKQFNVNQSFYSQREIILKQIAFEKLKDISESKKTVVLKKDELKEILTEFFNFRYFDTSVGEHEVENLLNQILEFNLKTIDRNSEISLFLSRIENRRLFLYLLNFCARERLINEPYDLFSDSLSKILSISGLDKNTLIKYVGFSRKPRDPIITEKTKGLLEIKLIYAQHKNELKSRKLILFFDSIIPDIKALKIK